jgi:DinB superfamily
MRTSGSPADAGRASGYRGDRPAAWCDTGAVGIDWTHQLTEQLDWHWRRQLRPRYAGLADAEYFWEPVANSWNIHPQGQGRAAIAAGGGDFVIDFASPEPSPAPVTTIAWRLAHLIVGVFGARVASHFGGPPVDYQTFHYAGTAAQALQQLDDTYAAWLAGVKGLDEAALARPCGPAEGFFADYPMAALVLHINREALHHGAEIALLRDLYANR